MQKQSTNTEQVSQSCSDIPSSTEPSEAFRANSPPENGSSSSVNLLNSLSEGTETVSTEPERAIEPVSTDEVLLGGGAKGYDGVEGGNKNDLLEVTAEDECHTIEGVRNDDKGKGKAKERVKAEDRFQCGICLDLAEDPMVTPCGHLSCWPCCHEWLVISNKRTCPTCKAPVTVDKLIPIYSASGEEQKDPRKVPLPPRPRPAPPPVLGTTSSVFGIPFPASTLSSSLSSSSFSFQAGGIFPFTGVSMSYTYPPVNSGSAGEGDQTGSTPGFDLRRGLVPRGEQEWLRQFFQQAFLVLFFAVFVMITFAG